jgi:hypothetical protein
MQGVPLPPDPLSEAYRRLLEQAETEIECIRDEPAQYALKPGLPSLDEAEAKL